MKLIRKIFSRIRGETNIPKLVKRGLKVGSNLKIMGGCIIDPSHCWHIEIGDHVTLAPRVHILAHDTSTKHFLNYTKVANVKIGNHVFVGAGTIILPGVEIGDNSIIGAGSVVSKNIPENTVSTGAPASVICSLDEYLQKEKSKMNADNCFDETFTLRKKVSAKNRKLMKLKAEEYKTIFVD